MWAWKIIDADPLEIISRISDETRMLGMHCTHFLALHVSSRWAIGVLILATAPRLTVQKGLLVVIYRA
jgi:hypothetical protein